VDDVLILGIDPASTTQPGYAVVSWTVGPDYVGPVFSVVYLGEYPPPGPVDAAAVEGQWFGGPMGAQRTATLAFDAGYRLASVVAPLKYRIPPQAWRKVLWPTNGGSLPKAVVVARLRRLLGLDGPEPRGTDDEIEAAGIALAVARSTAKGLKKWRVVK
jgi:hypothetical protein